MPKWLTFIPGLIFFVFLAVALAAPIGPMPGIWLGGEAATTPAQWSQIELPEEVQLKTTGGWLPRVVNIWVVEADNALFVFGASGSGWVEATLKAPEVQLRVDNQVYALHASPLTPVDTDIYQQYIDRYAADYPDIVAQMPKMDELHNAGVVFRLDRG